MVNRLRVFRTGRHNPPPPPPPPPALEKVLPDPRKLKSFWPSCPFSSVAAGILGSSIAWWTVSGHCSSLDVLQVLNPALRLCCCCLFQLCCGFVAQEFILIEPWPALSIRCTGVYAFGFLFMLPQLFVNYKVGYDDLIALLISQGHWYSGYYRWYPRYPSPRPTLHRLGRTGGMALTAPNCVISCSCLFFFASRLSDEIGGAPSVASLHVQGTQRAESGAPELYPLLDLGWISNQIPTRRTESWSEWRTQMYLGLFQVSGMIEIWEQWLSLIMYPPSPGLGFGCGLALGGGEGGGGGGGERMGRRWGIWAGLGNYDQLPGGRG